MVLLVNSTHSVRVKTYHVLSMKPHLNQSQELTIKNLIGREDVWMLMSQLNHVYILPVTFSVLVCM